MKHKTKSFDVIFILFFFPLTFKIQRQKTPALTPLWGKNWQFILIPLICEVSKRYAFLMNVIAVILFSEKNIIASKRFCGWNEKKCRKINVRKNKYVGTIRISIKYHFLMFRYLLCFLVKSDSLDHFFTSFIFQGNLLKFP